MVTRTATVTGASRDIGASVAERLAQGGVSVVVNYGGSEAEASALAKNIKAGGGHAITVQADVSKAVEKGLDHADGLSGNVRKTEIVAWILVVALAVAIVTAFCVLWITVGGSEDRLWSVGARQTTNKLRWM